MTANKTNDARDEKRPGATDRTEDESTTLVAATERDARLARIERKQLYTHVLLALTLATVSAATAVVTGDTVWGIMTVVTLAAAAAFSIDWKTASNATPTDQ